MTFRSINPYTRDIEGTFSELSEQALHRRLEQGKQAQAQWRNSSMPERKAFLLSLAEQLRGQKKRFAQLITAEMGKILRESEAEVEKCAWLCEHFAESAEAYLKPSHIPTEAKQSFVRYEPLGHVLAIMPWNFPFWQVFRCAAPAIAAGNGIFLKHAPNVFGCAKAIEGLFADLGQPHLLQALIIDHGATEKLLGSGYVQALAFTGSENAGRYVAGLAAGHLKKQVLELGGSNAMVVLPDADLTQSVELAVKARMMNAGQSCIAGKRTIVVRDIADEFKQLFLEKVNDLKVGDPMQAASDMGPLAREDLAEKLQVQVAESIEKGAHLLLGGERDHCLYQPTMLEGVQPGMPAFDEETFGPVAAFIEAKDEADAIELAARTRFGLGDSICTSDPDRAMHWAAKLEGGAVFFNDLVKSDPRLPFGGTKASGYGRELSQMGILEFTNAKTIVVR